MTTVDSDDLRWIVLGICALRAQAVVQGRDPWAVRQGLVLALALDTEAALEKGVPKAKLAEFDIAVKLNVGELVKQWGLGGS